MIPASWAWLLWALPLAYVLPSDRVLEQVEQQRPPAVAVHVVADLRPPEGQDPTDLDWPARVEIDVHPTFGTRFLDSDGGRLIVRGGRVVASNRAGPPVWLPQLEPLVISAREPLESWLAGMGVAWDRNELGRCGREDCFVLGGRQGGAQLWIEKETLEVRKFASASGRRIEFSEARDFGGIRFPGRFDVWEGESPLARWLVQSVYSVPALGQADFAPGWTQP